MISHGIRFLHDWLGPTMNIFNIITCLCNILIANEQTTTVKFQWKISHKCSFTDLRLNFSLFSHVTLKLNRTIVDVDVFVSDSLKKLIEDSFQTDG